MVRDLEQRFGYQLGELAAPKVALYKTTLAAAQFEHLAADQGCAFCKATSSQIHHYLPRALVPERQMEGANMVRLCMNVHRAVHDDKRFKDRYAACIGEAMRHPTLAVSTFFDPFLAEVHEAVRR